MSVEVAVDVTEAVAVVETVLDAVLVAVVVTRQPSNAVLSSFHSLTRTLIVSMVAKHFGPPVRRPRTHLTFGFGFRRLTTALLIAFAVPCEQPQAVPVLDLHRIGEYDDGQEPIIVFNTTAVEQSSSSSVPMRRCTAPSESLHFHSSQFKAALALKGRRM